jgi:hypothetical protein
MIKDMSGCNRIKLAIDEADSPDLLPYEAVSHISSCAGCNGFAEERRKLRQALASAGRVTVPHNFDLMLSVRLRERTERKSIFWIQRPGFVRFASAAAVLLIAVFGAQYAGLFSNDDQPGPAGDQAVARVVAPASSPSVPEVTRREPQDQTPPAAVVIRRDRQLVSHVRTQRARAVPSPRPSAEEAAVMLVLSQGGEREVSMPTVSVGAQTLLYGGAGRQGTSGARASF